MTTLIIVLILIIIDTAATTYIVCYFLNNIKKNNEYLHRIEDMPVQINIDADRLVEEIRRELIKQQEKRNAPSGADWRLEKGKEMTNKQAITILLNAAAENDLGARNEDELLDLYDALELAIDALDEVIKLERDPLDTFAPENRTDLRS